MNPGKGALIMTARSRVGDRGGRLRTLLVTAVLASALTYVFLRWGPGLRKEPPVRDPVPTAAIAASPAKQPSLSSEEEINVRVYNQVSPGVVNITTTVVEYDFFLQPIAEEGTGSGAVLDRKGHIVTNFHVVDGARALEVALPDQTKYRATFVGADRDNDLAVIRLADAPPERLYPVPLGDSSTLKVGQKVLAIGNPFRLQNTLTVGVVSSLGRQIRTDTGLIDDVIQTDAAINPGSSGGPLLNTAGELIGINTSIIGKGNIGIGFAVPVDTVRRVVTDLIKEGRVVRPWLGFDGYTITENLARALDLPVTQGVLVARVASGGSFERAGIRGASRIAILYNERILIGGDIITHVDGREVDSREQLRLIINKHRPGESVRLTIYRGSARMDKDVLLVEQPPTRGWRF
ncbi:MAG: trypsin-like peptidase domain-containing protein [Acidobacteria bacterium]|nr:trypsin-like peptidase domain-containing protein [Acidobacteriota bacterium]